jgi:hypothetical protein
MLVVGFKNGEPLTEKVYGPYITVEFIQKTIDWRKPNPNEYIKQPSKTCVVDDFAGLKGEARKSMKQTFT